MWQLYVKYALPIFVLSIIGISIFREIKQYKKLQGDSKAKTKIIKKYAVMITISLLLLAVSITLFVIK
ncbi:hypothetical protein [Acetivibrio saccincola]|jgi:hypothetical protein|uniref:Uncharacterized protein n=1 Tax=Acetivibrio saccincola TaxID=1677857 RepID=A0A2K9DXU2_9FIRM|nr:hypothetical protein [Acetivibrio saccincola]AUG56347.1 hypothetical protein HVS_01930 [Acetivibrio saccincola]PQQ65404.1 hypothetical protein B9R14_00525 [Acetivibrio saccincola]